MDFYGEAKVVRRVLSWYKHCDRAQRGWLDGRNGRTETRSRSPLRPAHRADTETASRDLRSGEGLISVHERPPGLSSVLAEIGHSPLFFPGGVLPGWRLRQNTA